MGGGGELALGEYLCVLCVLAVLFFSVIAEARRTQRFGLEVMSLLWVVPLRSLRLSGFIFYCNRGGIKKQQKSLPCIRRTGY